MTFKDPPEILGRYLGICHHLKSLPDGTQEMATEAKDYVLDAVQTFMKEAGVSTLPWVPTPSVEVKFKLSLAKCGIFADNAASHLMKLLYVARLVRGDFLVCVHYLSG